MKRHVFAAALFGPLLALCGCVSDQQASVDMLNRRLQQTLGPELADNRVTLQPTNDGAVVTLLDEHGLPDELRALDNRVRDPRASMIEGMLAPDIMQLSVTDTGAAPEAVRKQRVDAFVEYMEEYRLRTTLQNVEVLPTGTPSAGPPGLAVTLRVICPERTNWPGYGQGQSLPSCH